ncbi:MAG: TerB family tellurite resistance protein [Alphaproteobacteria bacterium]
MTEFAHGAVFGRGGEETPGAGDPRLEGVNDQVAFTIAVIALSAKMAKADGVVTDNEVMAFNDVLRVPPEEAANVRRVFNLARKSVAGFDSYARQISKMFEHRAAALEDLLDGLFHIAKADGVIHPGEFSFLQRVAEIFGFTGPEWERIKCSHIGCDEADPHTILGLEPGVPEEEVKAAYRRLARQHHPDALRARGVPEEFVDLAERKLASINEAYDRLRKQRGFR